MGQTENGNAVKSLERLKKRSGPRLVKGIQERKSNPKPTIL
jgi:hypothetical protein